MCWLSSLGKVGILSGLCIPCHVLKITLGSMIELWGLSNWNDGPSRATFNLSKSLHSQTPLLRPGLHPHIKWQARNGFFFFSFRVKVLLKSLLR